MPSQSTKEVLTVNLVDDAMQKAGGSLDYAAVICGVKQRKLIQFIEGNPELIHWLKDRAPNESEVTQARAVMLSQSESARPSNTVDLTRVLSIEDGLYKHGLQNAGFSDAEVKEVIAVQQIAQQHFKSSVETLHGGMVKSFIELGIERRMVMNQMREAMAMITDTLRYPYGSPERQLILSEIRTWTSQLRAIGDEIIRTNEVVHKGALVMALVKKAQKNGKTSKKIGFVSGSSNEPGSGGHGTEIAV